MAGYFSADRQLVLGNEGEDRMAERKGHANAEPKTEMKGADKGQLPFSRGKGKAAGKKSNRNSSRK